LLCVGRATDLRTVPVFSVTGEAGVQYLFRCHAGERFDGGGATLGLDMGGARAVARFAAGVTLRHGGRGGHGKVRIAVEVQPRGGVAGAAGGCAGVVRGGVEERGTEHRSDAEPEEEVLHNKLG
jgi:hypothetical protein